MTLIRSKTTRRSAPITRSRLRNPTSKSTTTTFCPFCASAEPRAAVEVVLPTPPFPEVTTSTLPCLTFVLILLCRGLGFFIAGRPLERDHGWARRPRKHKHYSGARGEPE